MQNLSDQMSDNQFASVSVTCIDCHEPFIINLERTSPTEITIKDGIIAKKDNTYLCKCPTCNETDKSFGTPCDVYSRVVGYLRPVCQWNDAKQEEFDLRKNYTLPK